MFAIKARMDQEGEEKSETPNERGGRNMSDHFSVMTDAPKQGNDIFMREEKT